MTKALIIIAIAELIGVTVTIFNTVMWLYFNKKEDKRRDAQDRAARVLYETKRQNECFKCVYNNNFCIPSDYGRDESGVCTNFKNVFEEVRKLRGNK